MKNLKYILVALFALILSTESIAQTAVSSYFLDGAFYNYKLNPAMKAERGYFSIVAGNMSFGTKGNVGISNFLFPTEDGRLTTFMSGSVGQDEFLSKLDENIKLGFNGDMTLLAAGFRAFGGFMSFDVSLHTSASMTMPKGLFEFAKKGLSENSYSLGGFEFNTTNYASVNLGYSHEIIKGLRVGGNLKYLAGLAHANMTLDKMDIELSEDRWLIESHAQIELATLFNTNVDADEGLKGVTFAEKMTPKASGFGVDLGVEYNLDKYVPGLTVSASVVDLGFIKWGSMMKFQSADGKLEFDGFDEIDYNDMESSMEKDFEQLSDDASKMLDVEYLSKESGSTSLNTTMYIGAEYAMPFYKPLSVGALYSQRFSQFECNRWYQVRGFVNVAPIGWFSASVNYGFSTYGPSLGWMLNFHPVGVNFFVGSDFVMGKVSPQFIPLYNMNSHLTMGLSIALGKKK